MKILASVRLTVILIAVIIASLIVGSFLDPKTASSLIYKSFWFFGLIVMFLINLCACTIPRLVPFRGKRIGFYITHLSILVMCLGFLLDTAFGISGSIILSRGEKRNHLIVDNGSEKKLPFEVQLESFSIERYSDIVGTITVYDRSKRGLGSYPVKQGAKLRDNSLDLDISVDNFIPDFAADLETGAVFSRSQELDNPAIRITVRMKAKEYSLWLFSLLPGSPLSLKVPGYVFGFECDRTNATKSYKSEISLWEGNRKIKSAVIEVNNPFSYKGYSFLQASYDSGELAWSGLAVAVNPGLPFVYCGFIFLVCGVIVMCCTRIFFKEKK